MLHHKHTSCGVSSSGLRLSAYRLHATQPLAARCADRIATAEEALVKRVCGLLLNVPRERVPLGRTDIELHSIYKRLMSNRVPQSLSAVGKNTCSGRIRGPRRSRR